MSDVPLPKPDGSAEANKVPHPGGGYEYDEVPAWSESLVHAHAAAVSAAENARLRDALELIAAPMRPDGTWNRERLACQQIAIAALKGASHE
jgi:hypothetical protein